MVDPNCSSGWSCANVGGATGTESLNNGTYSVTGGGGSISGSSDTFQYVYQSTTTSSVVMSARIASQTPVGYYTPKAGLMLREGTGAGARYYDAVQTSRNGLLVEDRPYPGSASVTLATLSSQTLPV